MTDILKVFIFSSVHPWNDTRVFYKETISLAKKGYEVKLCAVQNDVKYEGTYGNLTIEYLPKVKRLARPVLWFRLFFKALREKADIYHFHDPELLLVGYFLKLFTNSKVIYDMHEDFPAAIKSKSWIPKFIRGKLSSLVGYIEKVLIKKCDAVIYAEKYYKNNYTDISIVKEDILNYPLDNTNTLHITPNKVPNIIYAGAISKTRGLDEMLKMARELRNKDFKFKLILIGSFSKQLKQDTLDFIKVNNLNEYIELPGRLPLHKVFDYYAQADIGLAILHPEKNYLQSLATKIFEYMSFGIPVVASNFPDWKELIESSESGVVVNPFNIEEITEAVHKILNDKELSVQLGENGFKAYQEKYNWKVEEKKLIKLYKSILGGN